MIQQLATDPKSFLAPSQNAAREEVNGNFSGVSDALRDQFMSSANGSGGGRGGKAAVMADVARRGELSKVDNTFNAEAAKLPLTAAQLMQQFLGMDFGETTSGATTGSTVGTGTTSTAGTGTSTAVSTGTSETDRQAQERAKSTSGGFRIGL